MIKGYCDPKFQKVYDAFSNSIESGFETGAALSIEHKGNIIAVSYTHLRAHET